MAKMSKKPPRDPGAEFEKVSKFIFEGLEGSTLMPNPEPITHIPNVDMYSTTEKLLIEVEMPGVNKDDIEITLQKGNLAIKALKFECFEEEKINYVCMERSFGRLYRTVEIPFPVDTARIKAVYRNGVLTITVPRVEDKRSSRHRVPVDID